MPVTIAGIGTAVPPHRIAQSEAAHLARPFACKNPAQERLFHEIYRRSGVESRYGVVLDESEGDLPGRQAFYTERNPSTGDRMRKYEEKAGDLAISAANRALDKTSVEAGQITHLVTVSCSGFHSPGIDVSLVKQLGLSREIARTHIGFMGCHGLINGLRVAQAYIEADQTACVMLCAVELCTLHHQYGWNTEQIIANALFADGAAAMILRMASYDTVDTYRVKATGSTLIADCEEAMSWRISDHGFTMTLSSRVPELIGRHVRPWLDKWLMQQDLDISSVGSWAIHPGGPRILATFGESAGLDRKAIEPSYRVLAEYGNMSSPTVAFILDALSLSGAPRPTVALAFGPGLAVETVLLV